jgi:hypothetical protein
MSGRQPDYLMNVGIEGEKYRRRAGAGWKLKGDRVAIKIASEAVEWSYGFAAV